MNEILSSKVLDERIRFYVNKYTHSDTFSSILIILQGCEGAALS